METQGKDFDTALGGDGDDDDFDEEDVNKWSEKDLEKQVAAAQKEIERTKLREEKKQRKLREEIEKQEAEMHNPVLRAMNQKKRKVMPEDD